MSRAERDPPNLRDAAVNALGAMERFHPTATPFQQAKAELAEALEEHDTTAYVVDLEGRVPPGAVHVVMPVGVLEELRSLKAVLDPDEEEEA